MKKCFLQTMFLLGSAIAVSINHAALAEGEENTSGAPQTTNSAAEIDATTSETKGAESTPPVTGTSATETTSTDEGTPAGEANVQQTAQVPPPSDYFLSDGNRMTVKEKGFSIIPPKGWEIYTNGSESLLMQVPKEPSQKYQRTIQVMTFHGPRFIDEFTATEFEETIVKNYSQASLAIQDYHIRNHMGIDLANGEKALLFYSEFKLNDFNMMQAHILTSSETHHYMTTYTDVAEHFEGKDANQFLTEAWNSMISIELDSQSPSRFEGPLAIGIGTVGVVLLLGIAWGVRSWLANRSYQKFLDEPMTEADTTKTQMSELVSKPSTGFTSGFNSEFGTIHEDDDDDQEAISQHTSAKSKVI